MWAVVNSKSSSWNIVERLCFPAPKPSYTIKSFPEELILVPRADGEKVPCLFLPFRHARFVIIYFHANAEDLGLCYTFCTIIRDLFQVHMLAVEYPGYGICPGHCDEDGIMANATAALNFALETLRWPCDGIKLLGRSLGTGPAVALAAQYDVAGVILVTPFLSIREIFKAQVGGLAEFITDRFPNYKLAGKIESPTLIIHGQQDTLIPISHSKRIYEAVPAKKMMVCPAAMAHNTSLLANVGAFVLPMTQFFSLPDYTFEDIEVPEWVFPDSSMEELESTTKGDDSAAWVCGPSSSNGHHWIIDALTTPRGGTSTKPSKTASAGDSSMPGRPSAGNAVSAGNAASAGRPPGGVKVPPLNLPSAGAVEASSARSSKQAPKASVAKLAQPLKESPRGRWATGGLGGCELDHEPSTLKVSRNYDFRTPSPTPRERCPTDNDTMPWTDSRSGGREVDNEEAISADDIAKEMRNRPRVVFSEEMLHAIKNGIEWLVDTDSDVGKLGQKREASRPSPNNPDSRKAPLSPLRGAPELRSRVVQRLGSDNQKSQIEAEPPRVAAGDQAVSAPETRMPSYAENFPGGNEAAVDASKTQCALEPKRHIEVSVSAGDSAAASTAASSAPSMAPAAAPPSMAQLLRDNSFGDSVVQELNVEPHVTSIDTPVTDGTKRYLL
mmetsp:Transcript_114746/g.202510  ORF Transcript_114746/g.202510 Transcript_114746/m.202510 type:complete len:669 (+) Transcript_114746:133-2139(+)